MQLLDYDERMAILIQEVQGRQQGKYYLPDMAGVGLAGVKALYELVRQQQQRIEELSNAVQPQALNVNQ